MNKKKLIIGIVGVLVVAGGIGSSQAKRRKAVSGSETAKVGRSSISNTVTATGTVEPVTEVEESARRCRYHRQVVCRL